MAKTLFSKYENGVGHLPFIDTENLLRATIKHDKQYHIQAFCKTANGKFIIFLNKEEHKEFHSQVLNVRELIQNEDINFRILPRPYPKQIQKWI